MHTGIRHFKYLVSNRRTGKIVDNSPLSPIWKRTGDPLTVPHFARLIFSRETSAGVSVVLLLEQRNNNYGHTMALWARKRVKWLHLLLLHHLFRQLSILKISQWTNSPAKIRKEGFLNSISCLTTPWKHLSNYEDVGIFIVALNFPQEVISSISSLF